MLGSHGKGYFTSRRDGETEGVGGGGRRVCVCGDGGEEKGGKHGDVDICAIPFKSMFQWKTSFLKPRPNPE